MPRRFVSPITAVRPVAQHAPCAATWTACCVRSYGAVQTPSGLAHHQLHESFPAIGYRDPVAHAWPRPPQAFLDRPGGLPPR